MSSGIKLQQFVPLIFGPHTAKVPQEHSETGSLGMTFFAKEDKPEEKSKMSRRLKDNSFPAHP